MSKILIITYAKLGDSFILVPSLNLIKNQIPNAKIDFFSEKSSKHNLNAQYALNATGLIDNFYFFQIDSSRVFQKVEKIYALLKFRLKKYDYVFVLLPSSLPTKPETLKRFEKDIIFLNVKNYFIPPYISRQYKNGRLVEQDSVMEYLFNNVSIFLQKYSPAKGSHAIEDYLYYTPGEVFSPLIRKSIGICMGSDMPLKKWGKDNFYRVLDLIAQRYTDIDFLFIGGSKQDADEIDDLIYRLGKGKKAVNLDINFLYKQIQQECFLYLGVDTGVMHLFNLAKIPIITIFSARDVPGKWYPTHVPYYVFRVNIDCEGCLLYECPIQNKCINMIESDSVFQKVEQFIHTYKK